MLHATVESNDLGGVALAVQLNLLGCDLGHQVLQVGIFENRGLATEINTTDGSAGHADVFCKHPCIDAVKGGDVVLD